MKCPNCGGTGKEYWNGNVFCNTGFECDKCNGTGEIELVQTNEEWFNQLTTYDKAKWIFYQIYYVTKCDVYSENRRDWSVKDWEMWLKQPHTDKE